MNPVYCRQCRALITPDDIKCPMCGFDQKAGPLKSAQPSPQPAPQPAATPAKKAADLAQPLSVPQPSTRPYWTPARIVGLSCVGAFTLGIGGCCVIAIVASKIAGPTVRYPDRWGGAASKLNSGEVVYYQPFPGAKLDPVFSIINPDIIGKDGRPKMDVHYSRTREFKVIDLEEFMESDDVKSGKIVLRGTKPFKLW